MTLILLNTNDKMFKLSYNTQVFETRRLKWRDAYHAVTLANPSAWRR